MQTKKYPRNIHKAYHAHIYFDESTKAEAKTLRDDIAESFNLSIGRFHERLVGPHTKWSCQITFGAKDFDTFIPWMDAKRKGLTIFVHGMTGDDLKDHTDYAYWLGGSVNLNLKMFTN